MGAAEQTWVYNYCFQKCQMMKDREEKAEQEIDCVFDKADP